jgi:pyridoxine/pyridoxamine 5'-phosphate oxidase
MDKQLLFQSLDACGLGVLSSLGPMGAPQSALVGIAITPELEIIFDTVEKSRKFANIARDPRVAFLIGWQGEVTVQYEGVARQISSPSWVLTTKSIFANLQARQVA